MNITVLYAKGFLLLLWVSLLLLLLKEIQLSHTENNHHHFGIVPVAYSLSLFRSLTRWIARSLSANDQSIVRKLHIIVSIWPATNSILLRVIKNSHSFALSLSLVVFYYYYLHYFLCHSTNGVTATPKRLRLKIGFIPIGWPIFNIHFVSVRIFCFCSLHIAIRFSCVQFNSFTILYCFVQAYCIC